VRRTGSTSPGLCSTLTTPSGRSQPGVRRWRPERFRPIADRRTALSDAGSGPAVTTAIRRGTGQDRDRAGCGRIHLGRRGPLRVPAALVASGPDRVAGSGCWSGGPGGTSDGLGEQARKARIVAVATPCQITESSPALSVPSGVRYTPVSVSAMECFPAGARVMSASRAGNRPPPGPVTSRRSAKPGGIAACFQVLATHLAEPGRAQCRAQRAGGGQAGDPVAIGLCRGAGQQAAAVLARFRCRSEREPGKPGSAPIGATWRGLSWPPSLSRRPAAA
jgi:hypothetical protein